jgi:hypothetical protein
VLEEVVKPYLGEGVWRAADSCHVALEIGAASAAGDSVLGWQVHVEVAPTVNVSTSEMDASVLRRAKVHDAATVLAGGRWR